MGTSNATAPATLTITTKIPTKLVSSDHKVHIRCLKRSRMSFRRSSAQISTDSDPDSGTRSRSAESSTPTHAGAVWTAADDEVLASARASGMNWQPIAEQHFPSKSANACRKRHERLMDRRYKQDWDQERLEELAIAYFECRREMWAVLGSRLRLRWAVVEGKCMEKGLKNLQNITRGASRKRARLDEAAGTFPNADEPEKDSGLRLTDTDAVLLRSNVRSYHAVAYRHEAPSSTSSSPGSSPRTIRPRQIGALPMLDPSSVKSGSDAVRERSSSEPADVRGKDAGMQTGQRVHLLATRPTAPRGQRQMLSIEEILSPAE